MAQTAALASLAAAIELAACTREADLTDAQFEGAISNCAFYYGIDVASAREAFDNLSADQFWSKPQATHYGLVPINRPNRGAAWE
jgi:hypothetical protein